MVARPYRPPGSVWDQGAAATCPGLSWALLAAIGSVESDSGRSTAPGVQNGANAAGAEGPMQFEAATFAAYATVGPGGATPASPYNPVDAVYTAAALLCANGGATAPAAAVGDYNHSAVYVATVLVLAQALASDPTLASVPATALAFVAQQLGVPYLWGGTGDGGYDCSGLVQAAYRSAGVIHPPGGPDTVRRRSVGRGDPRPGGSGVLRGVDHRRHPRRHLPRRRDHDRRSAHRDSGPGRLGPHHARRLLGGELFVGATTPWG